MSLKIESDGPNFDWSIEVKLRVSQRILNAAYAAMKVLAEELKTDVRTDIARGGFGDRWQKAMRVKLYPGHRKSLGAAIYLYSKIPYAGIFEAGTPKVIQGKPLLWIPTKAAPGQLSRGRSVTPKNYNASKPKSQRLRLAKRKGKTPLLVADIGGQKSVPLFFSVPSVTMPSRYYIGSLVERSARRFEIYFDRALKGRLD